MHIVIGVVLVVGLILYFTYRTPREPKPLLLAEADLGDMSEGQLKLQYKYSFNALVEFEKYGETKLITRKDYQLALEKCVLYTTRLMQMRNGDEATLSYAEIRADILQQVRQAAGTAK